MIIELVGNMWLNLMLGAIDSFPYGFDPDSIEGGLLHFTALMARVKYFVPFNTLKHCFNAILGLYIIELTMSIINWTLKKVPGVS
jgi:hypothetical protein